MDIKVGDTLYTKKLGYAVNIVAAGISSPNPVVGIVNEAGRQWVWIGTESGLYCGTTLQEYNLITLREWRADNIDDWIEFVVGDENTIPLYDRDILMYDNKDRLHFLSEGELRTVSSFEKSFTIWDIYKWKYVHKPNKVFIC